MNRALLLLILLVFTSPILSQEKRPEIPPGKQDPDLNNLKHPDWYKPVKLGTLGGVTKIGTGKKTLVLLPGMGQHGAIFHRFMMRNSDKFTSYAFTPAGHGGTVAPQIPTERDYGKRTWSKAFENAVVQHLKKEQVKKVVLLGFFSQGVQHAIHIANDHPELVERVMLVGGELYRDFGRPMPPNIRAQVINTRMAVGWFKTVTPKTWYEGMFTPEVYSPDPIRAQRYWEVANQPTIPTLIQYLCEFLADDPREILKNYRKPVLALVPAFDDKGFAKVEQNKMMYQWFNSNWKGFSKDNKNVVVKEISNSRIYLFDDNPKAFDAAVSNFVSGEAGG